MHNYTFLAIGKTHESTESQEFKKYVGVGSSYVLAVNPDKKQLEAIYGHEIANEPEYTKSDGDVPSVRIDFIVKTDPEQCNGIEVINKAAIFLYDEVAYNKDKTKVQVIDRYGNSTWAAVEDAKMNKKLLTASGREAKIALDYHMARRGEADLVDFLKTYLNIEDAFNYIDGSWVLKEDPQDYEFRLEHIKDYFKGDVSEIREAIALMPKNKVKLLYGVTTSDKGQFQAICVRNGFILRNSASSKALQRLETQLLNSKNAGSFSNIEYKICPLQEYSIKPTDLSSAPTSSEMADDGLPW